MTPRLLRLKRRPEFLRVAGTRRKWAAPGLILQVRAHPANGPDARAKGLLRVGFTVSRKVGNAVERNRVKRRLRALAQDILARHARGGFDLVLIGRRATLKRPWHKLVGDLLTALDKMGAARKAPDADETATQGRKPA